MNSVDYDKDQTIRFLVKEVQNLARIIDEHAKEIANETSLQPRPIEAESCREGIKDHDPTLYEMAYDARKDLSDAETILANILTEITKI